MLGPSANFSSLLIHYSVLQYALWDLGSPPFKITFLHLTARSSYYDSLHSFSPVWKQTEIILLKELSTALGATLKPTDDHSE